MVNSIALSGLSILVVDDEEPLRETIGWLLEDVGHVVHLSAGGHEALSFLRSNKPIDIVVSDINMPGVDGIMLSRQIAIEFPTLPVLLISGRPRPAGVRAFIGKPFCSDALAREIENLAAGHWAA